MPRPVSENVPQEIRDEIVVLGLTGLADYAERKNLSKAHLYSLFTSDHSQVRYLFRLSALLGISPEELNIQTNSGNLPNMLYRLKGDAPWQVLADKVGCSDTALRRLTKEPVELKALKPYIKVADGLGWTLTKLAIELGI